MTVVCPQGHSSSATDYCDTCGAAIDPAAVPGPDGSAPGSAAGASPPSGAAPTSQRCPHCDTDNGLEALFCEACGYDFTTGAMPRGAEAPAGSPAGAAAGSGTDPGAAVAGGSQASAETPGAEGEATAGGAADGAQAVGGERDPAAAGSAFSLDPQPEREPVAESGAGAPAAAGGIPAAPAPASIAPPIPLEWVAEVWLDPEWYAVQEAEEPMPSPGLPTVVPLTVRSALIGRVSASKHIHPEVDCTTDSGVSRRHAQLSTDGTRWFVEDLGSSNGTFVGSIDEPLPEDPIAVGPKRELDEDDRIYVGAWTRIVVRRATPEEIEAASAG